MKRSVTAHGTKKTAIVSSTYHSRLGDSYHTTGPTVRNLVISSEERERALRASVLRTCRAVHCEAATFSDRINGFAMVAGIGDSYHSILSKVPKSVLAGIKSLTLNTLMLEPHYTFNVEYPKQ
jgi:hypothetical protein